MTAERPLSVVIVGSVGSALGANLRALGHEVRFALRTPRDDGDVGLEPGDALVAQRRRAAGAP